MINEIAIESIYIGQAVTELNRLKKKIQDYSNKSYQLESSYGDSAQELTALALDFSKLAKELEKYIEDTIEDIQYVDKTFKETDNQLSNQFS